MLAFGCYLSGDDSDMANVRLCIHRAASAIGGNCVEIVASGGQRLLLDAGRPLEALDRQPTTVPMSLDLQEPVAGILLSHAHSDHCGMLESLPQNWPVYCGPATESLLQLSTKICGKRIQQPFFQWKSGKAFLLGPFLIVPYLIDHSAFDAYALLIKVDGKSIFYSGDFRAHGKKGKLTRALMQAPPCPLDILIMEGTNLPPDGGSVKSTPTEDALEENFARLFKETKGRVFVSWSSTNIDRLVTLFRACKKTGRVLVPDIFCMMVLKQLRGFRNIPQPDWKGGHICAVVTRRMTLLAERMREEDIIEVLKSCRAAMSATRLTEQPHKWVIMARDSLIEDFHKKGVTPTADDTWIWSMWQGYLDQNSTRQLRNFFAPCRHEYVHTSGHASPRLLQEFAAAMNSKMLIPIHGAAWDTWKKNFSNLRVLPDGEWLTLDI